MKMLGKYKESLETQNNENLNNSPKNTFLNNAFKEKVTKIFIHGFLHLLHFNHIKEKEYQIMFREEQKIFRSVKKILI